MHFRFRAVFALLLLFALRASAPGISARPFRFDELAKAGCVGGFSLSPDGRWVAYSVGTPDVEGNRTATALWIQAMPGGEPRKLTFGEESDSDPKFSPNGKRLLFSPSGTADRRSTFWISPEASP